MQRHRSGPTTPVAVGSKIVKGKYNRQVDSGRRTGKIGVEVDADQLKYIAPKDLHEG